MSTEDVILSSAKSIFVLYLIVSGNFLANIFGCRVQDALNNSMLLKHLLGFMTMLFFVVLVDDKSRVTGARNRLLWTILVYVVFVLTTRMDYKYWLVFIVLMCVNYALQVYRDEEQTDSENARRIRVAQMATIWIAVAAMGVGFVVYFAKKRLEYKSSFDFMTFFLGKTTCAFTKGGETFKDDLIAVRKLIS